MGWAGSSLLSGNSAIGMALRTASLAWRRFVSANSKCVPCEGIGSALSREEVLPKMALVPKWKLSEDAKTMAREFETKDFVSALKVFEEIGKFAEAEGHHPDLHLTSYNKVNVELSTHALGGLTDNDFILGLKIDIVLASNGILA